MLERLAPGDRLLVSELSRLGRSLGQVIHIVDELVKRKIRFTAIKESIHFEGKQDLQTKVMVALFGLFAEVERDLISERTREGLASARAKGRLLGRPKGVLGKSRLDGKEEEIRVLLQKQVSKASIAKIVGVTRPTIYRFIRQGGYAQILKGYFYTNLVGDPTTLARPCEPKASAPLFPIGARKTAAMSIRSAISLPMVDLICCISIKD